MQDALAEPEVVVSDHLTVSDTAAGDDRADAEGAGDAERDGAPVIQSERPAGWMSSAPAGGTWPMTHASRGLDSV